MNLVFHKEDFPNSPGGDRYEWKEAEINFEVPVDGKYLIEITASAKNAAQNNSSDDDDLRIAMDNYEFGKYEMHDEKVSWKGFGTASSWDGTSLKGGIKTSYFFIEFKKGKHVLKFYADGTPTISELKVYQFDQNEQFQFQSIKPSQNIQSDQKGIPWMSFVFLGVKTKEFQIEAMVRSAKQKNTTDGDNLKVVINGEIIQNEKAPTSRKYKNFYFSGDFNQGESQALTLLPSEFEFLEDSVELWYDESPELTVNIQGFQSAEEWLDGGIKEQIKLSFYKSVLESLVKTFYLLNYKYASLFLSYSLSDNPQKLVFDDNSLLVSKIKSDKAYESVLGIIKEQIMNGTQDGQIILGGPGLEISFEQHDLRFSLHGIKKLEFIAEELEEDKYQLSITLFDIYDFNATEYDFDRTWVFVHMADILETNFVLKNFEIEVRVSDTLTI